MHEFLFDSRSALYIYKNKKRIIFSLIPNKFFFFSIANGIISVNLLCWKAILFPKIVFSVAMLSFNKRENGLNY